MNETESAARESRGRGRLRGKLERGFVFRQFVPGSRDSTSYNVCTSILYTYVHDSWIYAAMYLYIICSWRSGAKSWYNVGNHETGRREGKAKPPDRIDTQWRARSPEPRQFHSHLPFTTNLSIPSQQNHCFAAFAILIAYPLGQLPLQLATQSLLFMTRSSTKSAACQKTLRLQNFVWKYIRVSLVKSLYTIFSISDRKLFFLLIFIRWMHL